MTPAERGSSPIELALGVLVILVPLALVVLSFGPFLERRTLARVAAAETARTIVLSEGDEQHALEVLASFLSNNGIDPDDATVALCGGPESPLREPRSTCLVGASLERGATVSVRVRLAVPVFAGSVGPRLVSTSSVHLEPTDPYRSIP